MFYLGFKDASWSRFSDEMNIPINSFAISGLLTVVASGFMAVVMLAYSRDKLHRIWALFCVMVAVWGFGAYKIATAQRPEDALFWWKFAYLGVIFIPAVLVHFVWTFLGEKKVKSTLILYASGSIFIWLNLTSNVFINNVRLVFGELYYITPTPAYIVFLVWFALLVLYALTKLYLAYRVSESEEKRRIEHLFLGLAIGFTGGSFSFLPVFNVNLYPHLNSAIAFGYLIVGYAILKHKLMDIRVIATQWFVAALWVVIFARVILSPPGSEEQFFNIFLLAMTVIIGAFLVRSVIREIRQRERIEQLARKLRWTNRRLEQVNMRLQRANVKLAAANEQLATLDKAKSEFLSIASHQLYTPLTAIKGYLSMIMEGDFGKVPSRLRPIIDRVFRSSERLIQLIRGLLDISRIESGRLQLNLESVDLGMVAEELCQELVPKAQEKNLKFACHVRKAKLPSVVVDRQRIRQVLLNIVDNAIKYTETGRVDVYVRREGDDILFYVKDTGRGMTQREIARLFHKFTRLGGADKYHTEGAGLGLYVARRIVEEHHGKIWAESRGHGKGSTFYVRLPIEGTPRALKVGEKAEVQIKPAEVGGK